MFPKQAQLSAFTYPATQGPTSRSLFNSVDVSNARTSTPSHIEHLTVHSKDRDQTRFPNSNSFQIKLSDTCGPIKDVRSIKLAGGCMPDSQSMTSLNYLCLYIDELTRGQHIRSTNPVMQKAFAIIQPDRAIEQGSYFQLKADWFDFSHVKMSGDINQLTISVRAPDGSLYAFDNNGDFDLFFLVECGCPNEFA